MDDQTKRLRGGAVEVCPECDIAGCRHIRARAALAAQPAASAHPIPQPLRDTFSAIEDSAPSANGMQVFTQMRTAVQSFFQAQPAASAEPSDEELARLWRQVSGRETLRPDSVAMAFARALLSRYGRPAGDAVAADEITYEIWQDDMMVASSTDPKDASHYAAVYSQDGPVKVYTVLRSEWEGPNGGIVRGAGQMPAGDAQPIGYLPAYEVNRLQSGHSAQLRSAKFGPSYLDGDVAVYTAPVAAQKADDAKLPAKMPEYEAVGCEYPSNDSYQEGYAEGWNAAIDAAIAQQRKGE